ncbi:MAG TPA: SGNH/GDSL hydrolase family protein, partial [Acidimicrobiales bacterium]|nr:SGNH/GDSL hydrolase family protein [Acidimicrobiales bacterium]
QAWPAVFSGAVGVSRYVNVGISGATVQQALDQELPKALAATADLATVWLNVNDIVKFVSAEQYEGRLRTLVKALRRGGRARVLVANTPPLEVLPAARPYAALAAGAVASYNAAIARVVQEEGAELVDLHAAGLAAQRDGRAPALVAQDGFHPSTAGHAAVAAEFLRVYRAATAR